MKTKVADQAWIALALLHRENTLRDDFQTAEILKRAAKEFGELAPGVRQHLGSHAVASTAPSPGQYRMFTRTGHGRLRLYKTGDPTHPARKGKIVPNEEDIPEKYRDLVKWHGRLPQKASYAPGGNTPAAYLAFVGLIPAYDLKQMEELIERDCERVESKGGEGKDAA
jgi:hypothetical protein